MPLLDIALCESEEHPYLLHPLTGEPLRPIGKVGGRTLWPILGGAPDDDSDDDVDDEDDTDDEDDDSDDDASGDGKDDKKKDDDKKEPSEAKLKSEEAKRYRLERNQARREKAELESRINALENKGKPELETITKERDQLKERTTTLSGTVRDQALELAFLKVEGFSWKDPEAAITLAKKGLRDVEVDDDGEVDMDAVRDVAKELAEKRDYLLNPKTDSRNKGSGDGNSDSASGQQPKRKKGDKPNKDAEAERRRLENKYPALRR